MPSVFSASDIEKGYFQFVWIDKRILHSKKIYEAPYFLEAEISYAEGSSRAGIVLWVDLPGEAVQEPHHGDPGFNSEGIALYPTEEGDSMIVQFTGAFVHHNTPVTQIKVPKPDTASSLKGLNTYRIEDYDSAVYVFLNEAPFFLVELDDKTGPIYSSGTVYNAAMDVMGTFSDMEINDVGKV